MMNSTDEVHSVMVRVHGVVMTVAFSMLGVIGIFFAAWMKPVLVQNYWWFQVSSGFKCEYYLFPVTVTNCLSF